MLCLPIIAGGNMDIYRATRTVIVGGLVVIALSALCLVGCRKAPVDRSLLTDTPCAAPCWQGITPGVTSRSQAMAVLQESPYIRQDTLREAGTEEWGGVTWEWRAQGRRLQPSISWQNDVVQEITLGLTYDLTVGEIVNKYGPPEALSAGLGGVPEHWYWIADLYYPQRGLQFKAYTREYSTLFEPTTEVGGALLFVPMSLEERVTVVFNDPAIVSRVISTIRPWQGYGNLFEIYYESPQDLGSGE